MAAVVIITIIVGFASVNNMLQRNVDFRLSDTGDELDFESAQVLEFGVGEYDTEEELDELIAHFTTTYEGFVGDDKKIIFIIGDSSSLEYMSVGQMCCIREENNGGNPNCYPECSIEAYSYDDVVIGIIRAGGSAVDISELAKIDVVIKKNDDDEITVKLKDQEYVFDINPGENFYFVISQTVGGEEHVVRN
ncbi:hypothetical protein KAR91_58360 [Candidatus Pacearchaeota archaeon]|nr:hypothetical protein [Candidatus Pacearchaeota archaeon]